MLTDAIGNLLPFALGVALSPVPIIAIVLMLGASRARSDGPAFAVGWISGLIVVSVVVMLLAGGSDDADSSASTTVNWVKVVLGLLFFAMAAMQWKKRPKRGEEPTMPKWMATIDGFPPGRSFVLGALLSGVNPKNLALTAAAAASIAQAGLSGGDSAIAIGVFVVIGSVTVVGPVVFYLIAGEKADAPLASIKEFMADHNVVIMMVILILLGAKLLGEGFAAATT
jgi:threonine/homoserine/homoserine lactone efflux protein